MLFSGVRLFAVPGSGTDDIGHCPDNDTTHNHKRVRTQTGRRVTSINYDTILQPVRTHRPLVKLHRSTVLTGSMRCSVIGDEGGMCLATGGVDACVVLSHPTL